MDKNHRESLEEYKIRTQFMQENYLKETMQTSPGLSEKVSPDGHFRPFWGDTIVFQLDEDVKFSLKQIQEQLYESCGDLLADPLDPELFHLTLHDLDHVWGCDSRWDDTCWKAKKILGNLPDGEVMLTPVSVFSMVNTSLVLGFQPSDEESCHRIMDWYEAFEDERLFPLNCFPTFHITLAYYRPGCHRTENLLVVLKEIGNEPLPFLLLKKEDLVYWRFKDMNYYYRID